MTSLPESESMCESYFGSEHSTLAATTCAGGGGVCLQAARSVARTNRERRIATESHGTPRGRKRSRNPAARAGSVALAVRAARPGAARAGLAVRLAVGVARLGAGRAE